MVKTGIFAGGICKNPNAIKGFIGEKVLVDINDGHFRISKIQEGGSLLLIEGTLLQYNITTDSGRPILNLKTPSGSVYEIVL